MKQNSKVDKAPEGMHWSPLYGNYVSDDTKHPKRVKIEDANAPDTGNIGRNFAIFVVVMVICFFVFK